MLAKIYILKVIDYERSDKKAKSVNLHETVWRYSVEMY